MSSDTRNGAQDATWVARWQSCRKNSEISIGDEHRAVGAGTPTDREEWCMIGSPHTLPWISTVGMSQLQFT